MMAHSATAPITPPTQPASAPTNAHLTTATPELLAALIAVRARFQHFRRGPDEEMVMDRVSAAIAKATGK